MKLVPRFFTHTAAITGLSFISPALSQDSSNIPPEYAYAGYWGLTYPKPNIELPPHIPAPEKRLTFFADYAAKNEKGVPIYLVNRTGETINFRSQDSDPGMRLEHRLADGTWERAQRYIAADCGLSYRGASLPPGQHFAIHQYMPAEGEPALVRYRSIFDDKLVSNEGPGLVSLSEIEASRTDDLAEREVATLARALRSPMFPEEVLSEEIEKAVAALRLAQSLGDNKCLRLRAKKFLAEVEASPSTPKLQQALPILREIVAMKSWGTQSFPKLTERCLTALKAPRGSVSDFGMPEKYPEFCNEVLFDNLRQAFQTNITNAKPIVEFVLSGPPELTAGFLGNLPSFADELVPTDYLKTNLFHENVTMRTACIASLARRGHWDMIVDYGWTLSLDEKLTVLKSLANPRVEERDFQRRFPAHESERKFWIHCLETRPLESVAAIAGSDDNTYLPENLLEYLRPALRDQLKRYAEAGQDFDLGKTGNVYLCAINVLNRSHDKEDIELLNQFLSFRGYEEQRGTVSTNGGPSRPYIKHRYRVREEARRALLQRGIAVPTDLILEKNIPVE